MLSRDPFWKCINSMRTLSDVGIGWRSHFEKEYDRATPFFRIADRRASHYPCPSPCGMKCRMLVRHKRAGSFAFCGDDEYPQADPIDLSDEDVLLYEMNIPALCHTICNALSIAPLSMPEEITRRAWQIGTVTLPPGRIIPVSLAIPLNRQSYADVAEKLLVRGKSSHILLVPCGCDPEARRLIEDNGGEVFSLSDIAPGIPGQSAGVPALSSIMSLATCPMQPSYLFKKVGEMWSVRWNGGDVMPFKDSLGFTYFKILLENPYVPYSALDLRNLEKRISDPPRLGMPIEVADSDSLRDIRREIADRQEQLTVAEKNGDAGASLLKQQIDELQRYARSAYNLHERVRLAGSELEKARKSVSTAMNEVKNRLIANGMEDLATHLDNSAPTGTVMKYHPPERIDWNF